jgi:hypothetical protein
MDTWTGNWEIFYMRNPTGNPTRIINSQLNIPDEYDLNQNYPNPFNPSTTIRYELPKNSFVTIKVYNILGKEIETLVKENETPGTYKVTWDASCYPSGVYFYRLDAGNFNKVIKMVLLK